VCEKLSLDALLFSSGGCLDTQVQISPCAETLSQCLVTQPQLQRDTPCPTLPFPKGFQCAETKAKAIDAGPQPEAVFHKQTIAAFLLPDHGRTNLNRLQLMCI